MMLRSAGYRCYLPSDELKNVLRNLGCDTVLDVASLVRGMGYSDPMHLPIAGVADMSRTDALYVDVKAHRNGPKVWKRWTHLEKRTLWYRINGGQPEHVVNARGDHGDEVNPPCPILTPNQWYVGLLDGRAYTMWPPFVRIGNYDNLRPVDSYTVPTYEPPICLIHSVEQQGYRNLVDPLRRVGVRCFGASSPDGCVSNDKVPALLASAKCMIHLKSSDAPGYALYEAMAAGCPVVCTQRLIWKCKMHALLEPGVTCLTFDHNENHDGMTPVQEQKCLDEINEAVRVLSYTEMNRRIGEAGRRRLKSIMWNEQRDGDSLRAFMQRCFG